MRRRDHLVTMAVGLALILGMRHLVRAQQPLDLGAPSGSIVRFNLTTCPVGWTEYTALRGTYTAGLVSGGTKATRVGTALTDQENRATGQHNHAITDPGHSHGSIPHFSAFGARFPTAVPVDTWDGGTTSSSSATTGITINAGGGGTSGQTGVAGTNGPYIQLLTCQKS